MCICEIIMKTLRIFNKLTSLFIPVFTYTYNFQKSFEALNVHDIWYQTPNKKFIFLAQFKKLKLKKKTKKILLI